MKKGIFYLLGYLLGDLSFTVCSLCSFIFILVFFPRFCPNSFSFFFCSGTNLRLTHLLLCLSTPDTVIAVCFPAFLQATVAMTQGTCQWVIGRDLLRGGREMRLLALLFLSSFSFRSSNHSGSENRLEAVKMAHQPGVFSSSSTPSH